MFTKSSISQSMIDAVNKVLGEKKEETSIEPQQLDDAGQLWRPGVKVGIKPGSWSHRNEWFKKRLVQASRSKFLFVNNGMH